MEVLILQHPMETHNPKGTARLLHLSLTGSQLLTGEQFAPEMLCKALYAPTAAGDPVQPLLLYPGEAGLPFAAAPRGSMCIRLVVIDGTWRKSRKMLHANPPLQALARCSLTNGVPSRYLIRKAHAPHQLSTLEATCAALAQLQCKANKFKPLLAAMDAMVAQQQAFSRPI